MMMGDDDEEDGDVEGVDAGVFGAKMFVGSCYHAT